MAYQADDLGRQRHGGQVDIPETQLAREGAGQTVLGEHALADQDLSEAPRRMLRGLLLQRRHQLDLGDHPGCDEDLAQLGRGPLLPSSRG